MGSQADHKAEALGGSGSLADRELAYFGGGAKGTNPRNLAIPGVWTCPPATSTASVAPGNGVARLLGLFLPPCRLDRIGFEVSAAGTAGTAFARAVMWKAASDEFPGDVAIDTGRILADVAGAKNAVIDYRHPGGLLWLATITQGAPVTNASLRVVGGPGSQVLLSAQPTSVVVTAFVTDAAILDAPPNRPAGSFIGANAPLTSVRFA